MSMRVNVRKYFKLRTISLDSAEDFRYNIASDPDLLGLNKCICLLKSSSFLYINYQFFLLRNL